MINIFHKHKFEKDGRRLWCSCGKIITMPCNHLWQIRNTYSIYVDRGTVHQLVDFYVCVNCGEFKYFNQATGEVKLEGKKVGNKNEKM